MRKLLSVLLVAAMVLGLVGTAFAATTPSDVVGTNFESAVNRLNVLGILKGYEDGTFKPMGNITRAEFAAVVVRALGLEETAKNTVGATRFKDVPASHWAAGYINVAVGKGIIKGYPDGTFKPEANVSNAEAMAMLVRVLGYEPAVTGEWPMNYVSKAAELKLTEGLALANDVPAIRGNVAIMTDKALTVPLMVQTTYGTFAGYSPDPNKNLLNTYLGVTEIKGMVTATPLYDRVGLQSNQFRIGDTMYYLASGVTVDSLLGHTVKAWSKNGEVFHVVDLTPSYRVVTGSYATNDANTITLYDANGNASIVYSVDPSVRAFFNHASKIWAANCMTDGSDVTLIFNESNKVVFANGLNWDDLNGNNAKYVMSGVVTKVVNSSSEVKIYYLLDSGTPASLDLKGKIYTVVDANGAVKSLADIAANDIMSVATATVGGQPQYWIQINRNMVEGTVSKVTTTDPDNYLKFKVYIGDTAYGIAEDAQVKDGATVVALNNTNANSYAGAKVKAYLDLNGKLRFVDATKADTSTYAALYSLPVTVPTPTGDRKYVTLRKSDNTLLTVAIATNPGDISGVTGTAAVGDVVKYTLTTDNELYSAVKASGAQAPAALSADLTYGYDRLQLGGTGPWYYVTSSTLVWYMDGGKPYATTWSAVKSSTANVTIYTDSTYTNRVNFMVVSAPPTSSASWVALKYKYVDANGNSHIVVDSKGTEVDYTLTAASVADGFKVKQLGTLTLDATGKVSSISVKSPAEAAFVIGPNGIDPVSGIIYSGSSSYMTTSNTIVYDGRGSTIVKADMGLVTVGAKVEVYLGGSGTVNYIIVLP